MTMACPLSVGDPGCMAGGPNEDDQAGSLEFHCNLLALFAAKASSDPDIEDSCIWTVVDHQGDEGSPEEQLVLAYKQSGSIEDNGGWSFLLPASRMEDSTIENMGATQNSSQVTKNFLTFFKIYTRLQKDPDMPANFVNVKNVVFYLNHSREVIFPGDFLEKTEVKDFIFGSVLWKFGDDLKSREDLVDKLNLKCPVKTNFDHHVEIMTLNFGECSANDIEDFFVKVTFAFHSKTWELLEESVKKEIGVRTGDSDAELDHGMLLARIRERLQCGSKGRPSIHATELVGLLEELSLGGSKEGYKIRFNLCDPVSDFVGRRRELRQVLYFLRGMSKEWEVGPAKKVVLSGLGGVGKSELAREYCRRHLASLYDTIAWINAENKESIAASFRELAFENLGIEKKTPSGCLKDMAEIVRETFDALKGHGSLVVYDNAESFRQVMKYLPRESVICRMHIILTSRSRDWDGFPLIPLQYFHEKEALEMVKGSLGHLQTWSESDGLELCKSLGYYPLALKQAISFICEQDLTLKKEGNGYSIREYLKLLGSNMELTLDHPLSGEINGDYSETTYKVIMGTLQHLRKSLSGQIASVLLDVLSYFSADCIDVDVMLDANPKYRGPMVGMAFNLLSKLSVVTCQCNKARIHRLVQAVNRHRLRLMGMEMNVLREAMTFALPMDIQHMISVWEHAKKHECLIKEHPQFPVAINEKLVRAELLDDIMDFSRSNLETLMTVLGPRHLAVVELLYSLFGTHLIRGEMERDEGLVKRYFDAWNNVIGSKPDEYFLLLYVYGCSLSELGRFPESVAVFNDILSHGSPVLGANSDIIQIVKCRLLGLGKVFGNEAGNGNDLEEIGKWIREWSCSQGGNDEDATTPNRLKLGGKYTKTVNTSTGAARFFRIGGDIICDIISVRMGYAMALHHSGKKKEAFDELQKTKQSARHRLGECHLNTFNISCFLADMHLDMGRVDCAEKELDVISLPKEPSGKCNTLRLYVESLRAKIFCARGKSEKAMPIILSLCLSMDKGSINKNGLCKVMGNVSFSLDAGEFKVVIRMVRGILATLENCAGHEAIPPFFLSFLIGVSVKLSQHDHIKPALVILKKVHHDFAVVMGETHIETLQVKFLFGRIYLTVGDMAAMGNGLRYLMEVRDTLSEMEDARDPVVGLLMHEVLDLLKLFGM